jgi:hypothetical protein
LSGLITNAGGTTNLGANVTTTGSQSFGDNARLTGDVTALSTGGSTIAFGNTVNGAQALSVNTSGATRFSTTVGASSALDSLTTNAGGTTSLGGNVTTTGPQSFGDDALLLADITARSTGNSTIAFNDTVNGGMILRVNTTGTTTFASTVGNADALAGLITNPGGTTNLGGNLTTIGSQSFGDNALLTADITALSMGNSAISFNATVNGPRNLTVNTAGDTTFAGAVGGTAPLMRLTTDAGGTTSLGGNITTQRSQRFGDDVRLTGDVSSTSTGGSTITFDRSLRGNGNDLTTTSANGTTAFHGQVSDLTDLTVASTALIDTDSISTRSLQRYRGLMKLDGGAQLLTLESTDVMIEDAVNGKGRTLVSDADTTLGDGVNTRMARLGALAIMGETTFNGSTVKTDTDQKYERAVQLQRDVTLQGRTVQFRDTIDGSQAMTVEVSLAQGLIFGGSVGANQRLTSLSLKGKAKELDTYAAFRDPAFDRNSGSPTLSINTSGDFTMERMWSLGVVGHLRIDSQQSVTLGDLHTTGDLTINVGPAGFIVIETIPGASGAGNVGLASAGQLRLSKVPVRNGSGGLLLIDSDGQIENAPAFAAQLKQNRSQSQAADVVSRARPDYSKIAGQNPTQGSPADPTDKFEFESNLSGTTAVSIAVAAAIPRQDPVPIQEIALLKGDRDELTRLKLNVRDFIENKRAFQTYLQRGDFFQRADIFKTLTDVPEKREPNPEEYLTTMDRLFGPAVRPALATYRTIYFEPGVDEKTGLVTRDKYRAADIQRDLEEVLVRYLEVSQAANRPPDPLEFRAYALANGSPLAREYLEKMPALFVQIENLGLGPKEFDNVKSALLAPVTPQRAVDMDFYRTVRGPQAK